jgi:hypothetical protein
MFSSGEQPRLFAPTPSGSTAPDSPNLLKKIKRVTPHTIRFAPSKRIAAVIAVLCTECSELCCWFWRQSLRCRERFKSNMMPDWPILTTWNFVTWNYPRWAHARLYTSLSDAATNDRHIPSAHNFRLLYYFWPCQDLRQLNERSGSGSPPVAPLYLYIRTRTCACGSRPGSKFRVM